jgi:D-sedoheptulose 7-phosphate isomerase
MAFDTSFIASRIEQSARAVAALSKQAAVIERQGQALRECFSRGGTLYTCGNGGSAAQALHLAEELIGRYRADRPPYRAMCLNADPTALTCIANDFGFEQVFARQCNALLRKGDVLVVMSTSGASANLIEALKAARQAGAATIGLLGRDGGACRALCDELLVIPGSDSAHTQEAHLIAIHLLCELLESHDR